MSTFVQLFVIFVQIGSMGYLIYKSFQLIDENHRLRLKIRLGECLIKSSNLLIEHLYEELEEKNQELEKRQMLTDEYRKRIASLQEANKTLQTEPRYVPCKNV